MAPTEQAPTCAVTSGLNSHVLFPGSELWANVPVPDVPSQQDISGLRIPSLEEDKKGYVYWTRLQQGPKTKTQAYADKVAALILSVHPLECQDCKAPSPKELDGMRKHQKNKAILAERRRKPAKFQVPLGGVLRVGSTCVLLLAAVTQWKRLKRAPNDTLTTIGIGLAAGLLYRRHIERSKKERKLIRRMMAVTPTEWTERVRLLMDSEARKLSQGPYWASLHSLHQPTEWFNSILARLWPFYDAPISQNIMRAVDNVLMNVKPPIFSQLKLHTLKFGNRAPEFVSMTTFSVSQKRIVIHARMRFVGTDLQATVLGIMAGGKIYAGVKNLKVDARMRIEFTEPLPGPPYFAATILSFLEPLEPSFSLKLQTALLPEGLTKPIVKPILTNILKDKVFAGLFVWPNRLIIANGGDNPRVKPHLPRLQPKLKGLLAVTVHRAFLPTQTSQSKAKPVAGLSVDGLHWYNTESATDPSHPVWLPEEEDEEAAWRLPEASHQVLIPLKEMDLDLQVAIAKDEIKSSSEWRDRDNISIVARTTISLHDLQEGEVVEGWFRLVPKESRGAGREVELQPDPGQFWTPPWERNGSEERPERLWRGEFDSFQSAFCSNYGVEMPPMPPEPEPTVSEALQPHPLTDVPSVLPDEPSLLKARGKRHTFSMPPSEPATPMGVSPAHSQPFADATAHVQAHTALREGSSASAGRVNFAPYGAVYLTVRAVRARTLKKEFGVGAEPQNDVIHCPGEVSPASALMQVLKPWRRRRPVEGQRGCLFVKLHEGKNLSKWSPTQGYQTASSNASPYDTFVRVRLASESSESHTTERVVLTKIVTNQTNPRYDSEFEFLAERVSQRLELHIMTTPSVAEGRLKEECVGRGNVWLDDIARCPNSKLQRLAVDVWDPENSSIVTGTLIMDLEWIPLNAGPVGPPRMLPMLTDTRRGSFFVRLLCAWELPPVDTQHMTCAASVRVTTGGSAERTQVVDSMSPVWLDQQQFEYVGELAQVWLEVQHRGQGNVHETVARTQISIEDLRCIPSEAVLVTKCLSSPSDTMHMSGGVLTEDESLTSDGSFVSPWASPSVAPVDTLGASMLPAAHAHAKRAAACGSVTASVGSLASDIEAPTNVLPTGWLMFEVAWRPYDGHTGTRHARNFTFPSVDKQKLLDVSAKLHEQRQAEFKRALKETAGYRNAGLGSQKESAVVAAVGNCLRVEVIKGENLPRLDITGASDPYAVITTQSEAGLQMFRTKTVWSTTFPIWDEALDVYEAHTTGGHIEMQVWDDDKMRGDDLAASTIIDAGATLLSPPVASGSTPAVLVQPLQASGSQAPRVPLPTDRALVRDVAVDFPEKKHKFGVPRVLLRLTWVPQGVDAPWGEGRGASPLVPWRHTDLTPMKAQVAEHLSFQAAGAVAAAATPFWDSSEDPNGHNTAAATSAAAATASVGPQSAPRRGNLAVEIVEVTGNIETRYPKYVTVRCNKGDAGKTSPSINSCEYEHVLPPMDNISISDVLVFKFKGRGMQKFLIGQATVSVGDIVRNTAMTHTKQLLSLPLVGATASLKIRWSWVPITQYSG